MSKKLKTYDFLLVLIPILLLAVSISVIYSLVFGSDQSGLALRQGIFSIIGLSLMVGISLVDYRFFRGISWIFYIITILLLIYVDFFGKAAGGAMRWIDLGFFQLQPSELAKVSLVVALSTFYSSRIGKLTFRDLLASLLILAPPLVLILKEPDLGTALVVCFIALALFYLSRPKKIQAIVVAGVIIFFGASIFLAAFDVVPFNKILHDYQRNRIITFVNPNYDPFGRGYNVKQAQITVGSGGIFGRGLGHGSQSQLQFLPKPQTDFIFSGVAESFGFLGMLVYLSLYAFLIVKIINIGNMARDNFGMLICFGAASLFFFQVAINVGMNLGLAPVTGIPLPFASYGGSALVAYLFLLGLVLSVFTRHKKIAF